MYAPGWTQHASMAHVAGRRAGLWWAWARARMRWVGFVLPAGGQVTARVHAERYGCVCIFELSIGRCCR